MSYEYNTAPYAMPLLIPIVFIVGGCVIAALAFIVRGNQTKVSGKCRSFSFYASSVNPFLD